MRFKKRFHLENQRIHPFLSLSKPSKYKKITRRINTVGSHVRAQRVTFTLAFYQRILITLYAFIIIDQYLYISNQRNIYAIFRDL